MTQLTADVLAAPEAISRLTDTLMSFLKDQHVDARATHHVAMIIEEFLTNLATHGNCRDTPARVSVTVEPGQVQGEIVDSGPPYDPRQAPAPNLDLAAMDRPAGGLGLFLVHRFCSSLEYVRRDGDNHTIFSVPRN